MTCITIKDKDALREILVRDNRSDIISAMSAFDIMDSLQEEPSIKLQITDSVSLKDILLSTNFEQLNLKAEDVAEFNKNMGEKLVNTVKDVSILNETKAVLLDDFQSMQEKVMNRIDIEFTKTKEFVDSAPLMMVTDAMVKKVNRERHEANEKLKSLHLEIADRRNDLYPDRKLINKMETEVAALRLFMSDSTKYLDDLDLKPSFLNINAKFEEDKKRAEAILSKGEKTLHDKQILEDMADFWIAVGTIKKEGNLENNILDLRSELKNPKVKEAMDRMVVFANRLDDKVFDLNEWHTLRIVDENVHNPLEAEFVLNFKEDDTSWDTKLKGLHKSKNPILQVLANIVNKIRDLSLLQYREEEKEITNAYNRIAKKIPNGNDFSLYIQQDEDGNPTYELVSIWSSKYWRILKSFDRTTAGKKARAKFYDDNVITVRTDLLMDETSDVIKQGGILFGKSKQADKDAHIALLKEHMGEQGYADLLEKINETVEKYYTDRDNVYTYLLQGEKKLIGKAFNTFETFKLSNSPFLQSWMVAEDEKVGNTNYSVIETVPLRHKNGKETGFYDKNYDKIMADADHKFFYDKVFEVMKTAQKNFNYELGTHALVLPYLERTLSNQIFSSGSNFGDKGKLLLDTMMASMDGNDDSNLAEQENIVFDKRRHKIKKRRINKGIHTVKDKEAALLKLLILEKKAEIDNRDLTNDELEVLQKQVLKEIGKSMDVDLVKLIKLLSANGILYKNKLAQQETVTVITNTFYENNRDPKTQKSLKNSSIFLETFLNKAFYATKTKIVKWPVLGKKGMIKRGRRKMAIILEEELEKNQQAIRSALKNPEKNRVTIKELRQERVEIDKNIRDQYNQVYVTEFARKFLDYSRIQGLGWNLIAGVKNIFFGQFSNFQRGLQGDKFTVGELKAAYDKMLFNPVKATNIRKNIGLVGDVAQQFKEPTTKGTKLTAWTYLAKWLAPFRMTMVAENWNQEPVMIAMFDLVKVETADGDTSTLFEIMNDEGKIEDGWRDSEGNTGKDILTVAIQELRKVINETHGDYTSTLVGNNDVVIQSAMMYRRWLPEMHERRWGGERTDHITGRRTKGLYLKTLQHQFKNIKNLTEGKKLDKMTKEERQAVAAIVIGDIGSTIALRVMMALMEAIFCDTEDCEGDEGLVVGIINILKGVEREILFFASPSGIWDIATNPFPQLRTLGDLIRAFHTFPAFFMDSQEARYRSGRYKGENKAEVNIAKVTPFYNQYHRTMHYYKAPTYQKSYGNLWDKWFYETFGVDNENIEL